MSLVTISVYNAAMCTRSVLPGLAACLAAGALSALAWAQSPQASPALTPAEKASLRPVVERDLSKLLARMNNGDTPTQADLDDEFSKCTFARIALGPLGPAVIVDETDFSGAANQAMINVYVRDGQSWRRIAEGEGFGPRVVASGAPMPDPFPAPFSTIRTTDTSPSPAIRKPTTQRARIKAVLLLPVHPPIACRPSPIHGQGRSTPATVDPPPSRTDPVPAAPTRSLTRRPPPFPQALPSRWRWRCASPGPAPRTARAPMAAGRLQIPQTQPLTAVLSLACIPRGRLQSCALPVRG